MVKKQLVFSSNGRIRIQTIKFQFKWTNHEPPCHYCPSTPTAGGTAGGTARCYCPARLQRSGIARPGQAPAPPPDPIATSLKGGAIVSSGQALPSTTGISLRVGSVSGWPSLSTLTNFFHHSMHHRRSRSKIPFCYREAS
jgi:hypothetical protein